MSLTRGSGAKNASGERIALPRISRRDLPSGLPFLKYSSCAPGAATTLNVGLGMYSLIWPLTVILVRPVDVDVLDDVLVRVLEVLGERVGGLVHVVVGVEHREVEDA